MDIRYGRGILPKDDELMYPSEMSRVDWDEKWYKPKQLSVSAESCFAVIWKHLYNLLRRGVVVQVFKDVCHPLQRVDADNHATFNQRVEDGIVNGTAVALAEQVVFASEHREALPAFDGVVVDAVASVKGVASQSRP